MLSLLRRFRHRRGDQGSVAVYTVVFAVAVVALTALIVDGGIAMNARTRAADIAGQAARAAADDIDVATLRTSGQAVIGPGACAQAASLISNYDSADSGGVDRVIHLHNVVCLAPPGSDVATVRITFTTTPLVSGFGFGGGSETVSQSATAECGIDEGTEC